LIIYGKNPVKEFLVQPSSEIEEVFVSNEIARDSLKDITKLAEEKGVKISYLARYDLTKISKTSSHQGIAARISEFRYRDVSEILNTRTRKGEKLLILILDHIEDPQNLGAIVRTVNVLGAHGVIIPKDRSASVTPAVVKASAGAVIYVPISKVVNIVRIIRELKDRGIWIIGSDLDSPKTIHDEQLGELDLALVVGSEGKGLKRLVKKECDFLLSIPQVGEVSSLNASVAAGIMIYGIMRQRKK